MPEMDGIELSRRIRSSLFMPSKPVVVALTAETSESLHRRCASVGIAHILYVSFRYVVLCLEEKRKNLTEHATFFVQKPISASQLKAFFDRTLHNLVQCNYTRQDSGSFRESLGLSLH